MMQSNGFEEISKEANILLTPKNQKLTPLTGMPPLHNAGMPPHPNTDQEGTQHSIEDVKVSSLQPIQIRTKLQPRGDS
jgi:hypothetical protein